MLEELKKQVCDANRSLVDHGLVKLTWGNVSAIDRTAGLVVIKPSGISFAEMKPEDVAKVAAFVQRHAPGMRISMAGNRKPSDFKGVTIDVYSQVLYAKYMTPDFLAEAAERAKKGLVTTHYVCCGPRRPNTFMDSGAGEAFWCGAVPAFLGLDGFLRWAWNSWPQDPAEDATYWNWRAGDTFLCYPGGEPSWRFLELRNGIATAEKVRILRGSGAIAADAFAKAAARYDVKAANDGTCDFNAIRKETLSLVNGD